MIPTLFTAAHVLQEGSGKTAILKLINDKPVFEESLRTFHFGLLGQFNVTNAKIFATKNNYKDFAIAIFPREENRPFLNVDLASKIVEGSKIDIAGYGPTDPKIQGQSSTLNEASSEVSELFLNYLYFTKGTNIVLNGDSGGPMLQKGRAVGVATAGFVDSEHPEKSQGLHYGFSHPEIIAKMEEAIAAGAVINGFEALKQAIVDGSKD